MLVFDVHNVFRLALSSVDMEQRDYDLRTALHVAAAEGETVQKTLLFYHSKFLLYFHYYNRQTLNKSNKMEVKKV